MRILFGRRVMMDFFVQLVRRMPTLKRKRNPNIAALIGVLLGPLGLGIYFGSFGELCAGLLLTTSALIVAGQVGDTRELGFLLVGAGAGLWGYFRVIESNEQLDRLGLVVPPPPPDHEWPPPPGPDHDDDWWVRHEPPSAPPDPPVDPPVDPPEPQGSDEDWWDQGGGIDPAADPQEEPAAADWWATTEAPPAQAAPAEAGGGDQDWWSDDQGAPR